VRPDCYASQPSLPHGRHHPPRACRAAPPTTHTRHLDRPSQSSRAHPDRARTPPTAPTTAHRCRLHGRAHESPAAPTSLRAESGPGNRLWQGSAAANGQAASQTPLACPRPSARCVSALRHFNPPLALPHVVSHPQPVTTARSLTSRPSLPFAISQTVAGRFSTRSVLHLQHPRTRPVPSSPPPATSQT
jgi:hypothetical protein